MFITLTKRTKLFMVISNGMQDAENKNDGNSIEKRIYELGYLLVPTISQENIPINYDNLKNLILGLSGEIIADEMPKMLALAYSMLKVTANMRSKFDTAYFGWIKFEINPEKVLELKRKLNLNPDIIRFLIIKTVKENTIAAKRFMRKDFKRRVPIAKREGEESASVPINKEEIDKEIDAMVAV